LWATSTIPKFYGSQNEIQGTKIATIEGVAHLPNMEEPGRFNQIVIEFLSDLEKEVRVE
jgi:pimeloyl-ACP methyl ester carboxylesterase